jgi:hypothetical protein
MVCFLEEGLDRCAVERAFVCSALSPATGSDSKLEPAVQRNDMGALPKAFRWPVCHAHAPRQ